MESKEIILHKDYQDKNNNSIITNKDLNHLIWRSFLLQSSFNYERMQAGGWTYSLLPALKKIHKNKEDLALSMQNHMQFFNSSPQLITLIQGVIIAMEQSKENPKTIQNIKVALMGPIGGIGDALFFLTLLPISAGIGSSLALEGNIAGPIVFLLLYNIPYLLVKVFLMKTGYKAGVKAISIINQSAKKISRAACIIGLAVVGALIAKTVNFNINWVLNISGIELDFQTQLFDKIMPKLLPLLYTLLCFQLLRKNKKPITLIVLTVFIGLIGGFLGIF